MTTSCEGKESELSIKKKNVLDSFRLNFGKYSWLPIVAVFLVAISSRLTFTGFFVGFHEDTAQFSKLEGDERGYVNLARNIADGRDYATGQRDKMWRTPGYPIFLSSILMSFGYQLGIVRIFQAILGGISCVLVFFIGEKLFGTKVGLLSALYFAIYPPHVFMSTQILSENLLLPFSLFVVLSFMDAVKTNALRNIVACGVVLGLAVLTRPESGGVVLCIFGAVVVSSSAQIRVKIYMSACIVLFMFLVLSPWLIRNYFIAGRLVLSTVAGEAFWGGNNDFTLRDPYWRGHWKYPHELPDFDKVVSENDEVKRDQMRWRLGLDYLRNNYTEIPKLAFYKLQRFYSVQLHDKLQRTVMILSFGLLMPFMAIGLLGGTVKLFQDRHPGVIVSLIILYYNLLAIIFWGSNRFRLTIDPYLIIFGIWGLLVSVEKLKTLALNRLSV